MKRILSYAKSGDWQIDAASALLAVLMSSIVTRFIYALLH